MLTSATVAPPPTSLRQINLARVLGEICAADPPASRAEVSARTGLARPTVSRLVDELIGQGVVAELEPLVGQRGRPAVPLVAAAENWFGLGLEVNVGHVAGRLVDLAGNVLGEATFDGNYADSDPAHTLAAIADLGQSLVAERAGKGILVRACLAVPGLVDAQSGRILRAPNLGWWSVDPAPALARLLAEKDVPLDVGNEADFAALTVARRSPGRLSDLTDFLYVSGEVGIGSALVSNGEVRSGRHGWAGELGHVCVDRSGPRCACGAHGCLEAYAGQHALQAAAGVTSRTELAGAVAHREERALAAASQAATALGIAIAGALNLIDLSQVVLGGHLAELAPALLPGIEAELTARVVTAPFEPPTVIAIANDSAPAALGAAYAAVERLVRDPASTLG